MGFLSTVKELHLDNLLISLTCNQQAQHRAAADWSWHKSYRGTQYKGQYFPTLMNCKRYWNPTRLTCLVYSLTIPSSQYTSNGEKGEGISTYVGICQGDCLSAVLFIFYHACALRETPDNQIPKRFKGLPGHILCRWPHLRHYLNTDNTSKKQHHTN